MRLSGWKPSFQSGSPVFREPRPQDGPPLLYIGASSGETIASWRTRSSLGQGRYRVEGKIRTKDVRPLSEGAGTGAGLRISRGPLPPGLSGTGEWRNYAYEFRVLDMATEVEFVCELRASKGEAWFDPASMQIIRLP